MENQKVLDINDILSGDYIEQYIEAYCYKFGIEDLKKENIQTWRAICTGIGKDIFTPIKQQLKNSYKYNTAGRYASNNNAYDYFVIDLIADIYIRLSDIYNKIQSISIFALFSSVDYSTIDQLWKNNDKTYVNCYYNKESNTYIPINDNTSIDINQYIINYNIYIDKALYKGDILTIKPISIYKKIIESRSNVINDKLADNNNPVALFGAQNADKERYFEIEAQKVGAISLDQLPALPGIVQNAQSDNGGS